MADASLPRLDRIVETALYCDDLARSRAFYVDILGAVPLLDSGRLLAVNIGGASVLLLFQRGATLEPLPTPGGVVPSHGGRGVQHIAFAVSDRSQLDAWAARLEQTGVAIESRVRWPRGGESIYIRDPDEHSIELITPGLWAIY
ncbi:MAG TPA: VOC family protein [Gemmatimonadaceae bacterium]|nr:VOC family protein [Gemmatimonadaceae bacterium]